MIFNKKFEKMFIKLSIVLILFSIQSRCFLIINFEEQLTYNCNFLSKEKNDIETFRKQKQLKEEQENKQEQEIINTQNYNLIHPNINNNSIVNPINNEVQLKDKDNKKIENNDDDETFPLVWLFVGLGTLVSSLFFLIFTLTQRHHRHPRPIHEQETIPSDYQRPNLENKPIIPANTIQEPILYN